MNTFLSKFHRLTIRRLLILIEVPFLESCGSTDKRVPSIDVFGSYFPAWLISLAAGVVFTAIVLGVGRLIDIRPSGFPGFFVAVGLILIFSISVWFWLFAK